MLNLIKLRKTKLIEELVFNNIDICIITATDVEYNGVQSSLDGFIIKNISDREYLISYGDAFTGLNCLFGSIEEFNVCLIQSRSIGNATDGGAMFSISNILKVIRPQLLMMVGVCCGMESDKGAKKCPIYIANLITYYEYAKINESNSFQRSIAMRSVMPLSIFNEETSENYFVKKGQYICGEKVINSKKVKQLLKRLYPGSVALDMESYSLALLAEDIPYVVIKGASDFGIKKHGSDNQVGTMSNVMQYIKKSLQMARSNKLFSPRSYRLSVMISGSNDDENEQLNTFVSMLTLKILECGHKIINGYGKGIGEVIVLESQRYAFVTRRNYSELLELFPFPFNNKIFPPNTGTSYKWIANKIRSKMSARSQITIVINGKSSKSGYYGGVFDEYNLSMQAGNIIIPICKTGGAAYEIYNEYQHNLAMLKDQRVCEEYNKLNKGVDFSNVASISDYLDIVFDYINFMLRQEIHMAISE